MDSDGEENALIKASLDCELPALRRAIAHLLRAGARIPTHPRFPMPPYLSAVAAAGGYARYERAHCERLVAIFMPKPETGKGRRRSKRRLSPLHGLPAEVMHHIVSIWADCGGH